MLSRYTEEEIRYNIGCSKIDNPILNTREIKAPPGLSYFPFQEAGVNILVDRYLRGRKHQMLADEPGLGKTIQAIGVGNELSLKKIFVICPASLRNNWAVELEKWHTVGEGVNIIETGKDKIDPRVSNVISYDLLKKMNLDFKPDFICIDEAHRIKNPETIRTQYIIGNIKEGLPGIISKARSILLTGSPLPNGRPNEIWHILKKCSASTIDNMSFQEYLERYCVLQFDDRGDFRVIGSKRERELFLRLRGSGYMLRRLKKGVLKDLPPKIYKMVVFPVDANTAKIIEKEKPFSIQEIVEHGMPIAGGGPELRREMGLAKIPLACEFITGLLNDGVNKIGVTTHHRDVSFGIADKLKKFNPVLYIGGMSDRLKSEAEKAFQEDKSVRIFIGSEAAAEGLTLTAAHHVVDVEPEWVPEANNQKHDRYHRITQNHGVIIYQLVVRNSLDARILSSAAYKAKSTSAILDGEEKF